MTAKKVPKVEHRMMVKKLDRPTPFTIKGVKWQGAKKADKRSGGGYGTTGASSLKLLVNL
jgi:hypothetical protein